MFLLHPLRMCMVDFSNIDSFLNFIDLTDAGLMGQQLFSNSFVTHGVGL